MSERSSANHSHDRGHRLLFSHPRTIKDLVQGFIKEPWVQDLDFNTLTRLPADYVSGQLAGDFEARAGDVLWKIGWKSQDREPERRPLHLLILVEFQSTCDLTMAVRMFVYVGLLYQRLIKEKPLRQSESLPPVLPMVLYNGQGPWTAPLDIAELIAPVPDSLDPFRPRLRYHLIDEKRCALDLVEDLENVASAIFRAGRDRGPQDLREVVHQLRAWLRDPAEQALKRDLAAWLGKVVLPNRLPAIELPEIQGLDDFYTVMEDQMTTWTEQWFQDGYREGYSKAVLRVIEQKFGTPPAQPILQKIEEAEPDQLLAWLDRLVVAQRLDEVFAGA